jgi:ABC-type glutathione transport system ATPase component
MTRIDIDNLSIRLGGALIVSDVSLTIAHGSAVGLVGESGSGKTTLARAVTGALQPSSGTIRRDGTAVGSLSRAQRREVQLVSQDPYSSLNPRMTIGQTLRELLLVHRIVPRDAVEHRVEELLGLVRLEADAADAYPHQFSGGQRQRIAIARALAVEPRMVVADEPTSALDVSVQAAVIDLLRRLRADLGLTLLFISHDLGVVNEISDTVAVMERGRIVEVAPRSRFFVAPEHPYSRRLLEAVPRLSPSSGGAA